MQGFPEKVMEFPTELRHYFNFKEELSHVKGIILKGDKIVVPKLQIPKMLKHIHQGHLDIQSCLRRARQFFYWQGQYVDIIKLVKGCSVSEQTQRNNIKATVIVKRIPTLPWQIVASDLFELNGKTYLVICDNYSGYLDFQQLKGSPNQRLFSRITRSPIPTSDNNLKPKTIQEATAELQRLREKQANYSNKHTTRPDKLEINDKVRHKVAHRNWEGARVVEKPEGLPRCVIIQTDQGEILRRNFSHLHKTQTDVTSNRVVVPETKYTDKSAVQQVPAQAQSPAIPKSLPASTHSSPSTFNQMQKSNLAQPATAPRSTRECIQVIRFLVSATLTNGMSYHSKLNVYLVVSDDEFFVVLRLSVWNHLK
ncbi:hypothetical protein CBL_20388 [Carabus blaptoides fortunei]